MTRYGRGLICLSLTSERLAELQIPPMVEDIDNTSPVWDGVYGLD